MRQTYRKKYASPSTGQVSAKTKCGCNAVSAIVPFWLHCWVGFIMQTFYMETEYYVNYCFSKIAIIILRMCPPSSGKWDTERVKIFYRTVSKDNEHNTTHPKQKENALPHTPLGGIQPTLSCVQDRCPINCLAAGLNHTIINIFGCSTNCASCFPWTRQTGMENHAWYVVWGVWWQVVSYWGTRECACWDGTLSSGLEKQGMWAVPLSDYCSYAQIACY